MNFRQDIETPNHLTDTAQRMKAIARELKPIVKEAVKEVMDEDRKRFNWPRFLRNIASHIVGELDGRAK